MTYATLASLIKYPFPSTAFPEKKKYGFFDSDFEDYKTIATDLGIPLLDSSKSHFARHPLVYLVEAADDIAYQLMDLEDALKLRILNLKEVEDLFLSFFNKGNDGSFFRIKDSVYSEVTDPNERIAFLRAQVVGKLLKETISVFMKNYSQIMSGSFESTMIKSLNATLRDAMKKVSKVSVEKIYRHPDVISIELAGYNILGFLLDEFITAILSPAPDYSVKLLSLMPQQYKSEGLSTYSKVQSVLDFISGMTDLYALKLFKDIKGNALF